MKVLRYLFFSSLIESSEEYNDFPLKRYLLERDKYYHEGFGEYRIWEVLDSYGIIQDGDYYLRRIDFYRARQRKQLHL